MSSHIQSLQQKKLLPSPPDFLSSAVQYEVIMGSVAYGVSNDSSDMDIYAFAIPPKTLMFPHLRGEIPGFDSYSVQAAGRSSRVMPTGRCTKSVPSR